MSKQPVTLKIQDDILNVTGFTSQIVKVKNGYALELIADLRFPEGSLKQKKSQFMTLTASQVWTGKNAEKKARKALKDLNEDMKDAA